MNSLVSSFSKKAFMSANIEPSSPWKSQTKMTLPRLVLIRKLGKYFYKKDMHFWLLLNLSLNYCQYYKLIHQLNY